MAMSKMAAVGMDKDIKVYNGTVKTLFSCLVQLPGNKKLQGHKFQSKQAKPWNISPLILLSVYSSFSFRGIFS